MISEKRRQAARANGARSRGPKTPEGKKRSSRNATRHGLLSQIVVLPNESEQVFEDLVNHHLDGLGPVDDFQYAMVEEMAAASWRMRRAWTIEHNLMESALAHQPDGDETTRLAGAFRELADSPQLPLLHRYEARLHLMYQRAFRTLLLTRGTPPDDTQPSDQPPTSPVARKPGDTKRTQELPCFHRTRPPAPGPWPLVEWSYPLPPPGDHAGANACEL